MQDGSPSVLDHEISDNSIDQNTISHFQHHPSTPSTVTPIHKISTTMRPKIENTIVPLNSVTISHHSSNSHPTSSTSSDDVWFYNSTSYKPSSSSSSTDNVVLDLLTTFQNSKTSTYANDVESTSPVATTHQQFLFTKSPTTTIEDNTKFQTFQSVQETITTTTSAPTTIKTKNPSRRPTTTTTRPTKRHRPNATVSANKKPEKDEILSSTKKPVRLTTTTTTSKPSDATRRPATTTPSIQLISSKRPTTVLTKPTKRVTESTSVRPLINRTVPTHRPTVTNVQSDAISTHYVTVTKPLSTTTSQPFSTISYVETTKIPRPKPKPTKQIVKVPPTSLDHLVELDIPLTTTQNVVSTVTTTSTPSTVQQSSSTMDVETKTESITNGISPAVESSAENEIKPLIGLTTQRPILVTWSNIQAENNDTNESNAFNAINEQLKNIF